MRYVTGTLIAILVLAIVIFAVQNRETVNVSFLLWSVSISKVFVIVGSYLLGMVSGWGFVELVKRFLKNRA